MIVISAIALGVAAACFSAALMFGMASQKINAAIGNEVSSIQLHHPDFLDNYDIQDSIAQPEHVAEVISHMQGVKSVSERSVITGMIMSASSSAGIRINAVDPNAEKLVTNIHSDFCSTCGTYLNVGKHNQIIISSKLAEKLKVRVKSKIILRFQGIAGTIIDGAYKICGIYKTSNGVFDEINVFIDRKELSAQLNNQLPVNEIAVMLSNNDRVVQTATLIRSANPHLSVLTWDQLQPELGLLTGLLTVSLFFLQAIILAALAFGIVNTMLMVVLERIHELGMLVAIGMNRLKLFRLIMLETVFLSVTGGFFGISISILVTTLAAHTGIDLSSLAKGIESLGFDSIIYPEIRMSFFIGTTILVIITGILSSIYPARLALKINPADAVRGE
jgi:putative ABC transport system permease protein